ncbi:amino acid adenylation domain-containing protein [Kitasatospora sp. NPDC101157]|uniref:amino acid adenylation domain-containing protein n=1 Tax=Kitasatospora sp. NPDC101157 TaxID=3364098 RepID=UPI0037FCD2C1
MVRQEAPASGRPDARERACDGELVHERIAARAERSPDAVALHWAGRDTSYRELAADARRSADFLARRGVRRGDVVAVRADCVPDTVKVLLGIVRCGAAYAIVPPDWPPGRFERIAGLEGIRLCVVDRDLPSVPGLPTLTVEEALGRAAAADGGAAGEEPAGAGVSGEDPLCVFFTSGSTGSPKGVVAPHRGILRLADDELCVVPGRMVTYQTASTAWDAFAWELWTPLVLGGTCVLSGGTKPTGPRVREAIARGVNAMILNTVLFNALVDDDIDCFTGLELLVTGGERHSAPHLARCRRRHPGIRLQQGYGPAESSTYTTMHPVTEADEAEVPIGLPVTGTEVWLLDEQRRPVPDGGTGEIVIGGEGLALGYLGDPELTRQRFPVLELDGREHRVYLTGDLARRDPGGRLVFVGRRDRQVKIRGVRIEPSEVEAVIEQVPGVSRAAVVAQYDDSGRATGLAAVASSEGGPLPSADLITKTVAGAFPEAFVPRRVAVVERLPKLPNDKVDHHALAALLADAGRPGPGTRRPDGAAPGPAAPPGAGGGDLAAAVAIASAILRYDVGPDDDLFDQGATSMTAIRLATRLSRALGRQVTESDVLRARSITALFGLLADPGRPDGPAPAPRPADPAEAAGVDPLFSLEKFWHMAEHEPDLHESIMPMLFLLHGTLDADLLGAAVDAVVARHDALRARFRRAGRGLAADVLAPADTTGILRRDTGAPLPRESAEREARRWLTAPYPLRDQPPLKARLIPVEGGRWLLAVVGHHIAFDAWSTQVFWRDLFDAYRALEQGRPAFDAPAPSFFTTYREQLEARQAQRPAAVRAWRERVAGVAPVPFAEAGPIPRYGPAAEVELALTEELMATAARAANTVRGTVSAVFLAAWARVLGEFTGAADLAVCTPVSGRFLPASADSVGCYASMVALRLAPGDGARELVRRAAEQLREAMEAPLLSIALQRGRPLPAAGRDPLLQAYFLLEEVPPARVEVTAALHGEQIRVAPRTWVPEVHLELRPHPDLGGLVRYRTDVLSAADAERLAARVPAEVAALSSRLL